MKTQANIQKDPPRFSSRLLNCSSELHTRYTWKVEILRSRCSQQEEITLWTDSPLITVPRSLIFGFRYFEIVSHSLLKQKQMNTSMCYCNVAIMKIEKSSRIKIRIVVCRKQSDHVSLQTG